MFHVSCHSGVHLAENTKVKVRSSNRDTDFFDFVSGVLQKNISAPYPARLRTSNVDGSNKIK